MDVIKALEELNSNIKKTADESNKIISAQKTIDEAVKKEIEQKKKEAKELIDRIKSY